LLGGHVFGRADHRAGLRRPTIAGGDLCDAEVEDLDRARRGDEQVRRLEVAVHDAGVVEHMQSAQGVGQPRAHRADRQRVVVCDQARQWRADEQILGK
jgi:hypothetical protein